MEKTFRLVIQVLLRIGLPRFLEIIYYKQSSVATASEIVKDLELQMYFTEKIIYKKCFENVIFSFANI